MRLVRIKDYDLTPYILTDGYSVNKDIEYEEWQDGNGNYHRIKTRDRITGKIKVKFLNPSDYDAFVSVVRDNIHGADMLEMSVYCVNTNQKETADFFVSYTPSMSKSLGDKNRVKEFDIVIKEK